MRRLAATTKEQQAMKRFLIIAVLVWIMASMGCAEKKEYVRPPAWPIGTGPVSSGQYRGFVLADLDNDGNTDMAGASTFPGNITLSYGDGKGGWSDPVFLDLRGEVHSVATGDFNEDGFQDVVYSIQEGEAGVRVKMNEGGLAWLDGIPPTEKGDYEHVRTGDVNADGHVDIIAANTTSHVDGGIQVWLGDGTGNWTLESGPSNTNMYMDVTLADFDRDGNVDLVGAGWGPYGTLSVWLGDGHGGWSPVLPLQLGSHYGLSTADLDGDGNLDILVGSYQKGIQVFLGDGTGDFAEGKTPVEEGSFWRVLARDLDGDGQKDLVASSMEDQGVRVWSSQDLQNWRKQVENKKKKDQGKWHAIEDRFPSLGIYYEIAMPDLDGDGAYDLCAASYGEGIKVWLGSGGFPAQKAEKRTLLTEPPLTEVEENSSFKTIDGMPEYKLGPDDVLEITVWKSMEPTKQEILLKPDGTISFGFVDNLFVNGMTASELEDLLVEKLRQYIRNPRIEVAVKRFRSKFISVLGAINAAREDRGPGDYRLKGKITVLDALGIAGGPERNANLREVSLRRKDGQTVVLNLYKAIVEGDKSQNLVIDDRDIVFVPTMLKQETLVYVLGEVNSPGAYPFEREITLLEAVAKAGGTTEYATLESTKIVRGDLSKPEILSSNLERLIKRGDRSQNFVLANRDVVYVPRSFIGDVNEFIEKISPSLRIILWPGQFRDSYLDTDRLRITNVE
jgi:protein involved in polysaccharide export with SLBB domain